MTAVAQPPQLRPTAFRALFTYVGVYHTAGDQSRVDLEPLYQARTRLNGYLPVSATKGFSMMVDKDEAAQQFKPGSKYYLYFSETISLENQGELRKAAGAQ